MLSQARKLLLASGLLTSALPTLAQTYSITDVGSLIPNGATAAMGINASGQVVISTYGNNINRLPYGAVVPAGGGPPKNLGLLGDGTLAMAFAINDAGHVAGLVDDFGFSGLRSIFPAVHDGTSWEFLKELNMGGGTALAINNAGKVAGSGIFGLTNGTNGAHIAHAAIMTTDTHQDLGTLGGPNSVATAINDIDEVAGMSLQAAGAKHAFFWKAGTMTDLGTLGGIASEAWGINESGHVVGWAHDANGVERAFAVDARAGGSLVALGTLGTNSHAKDINNNAIIVGDSWVVGQGPHAFVKLPGKPMMDLNDLIPAGSGWTLQYASSINDSGVIVGSGQLNGIQRGFKLVPESCYADCDSDGTTTIDDFICFQTQFALADPYADCDGDEALTIDDFICFQTMFALGCG